jgi:hypothetical protein
MNAGLEDIDFGQTRIFPEASVMLAIYYNGAGYCIGPGL